MRFLVAMVAVVLCGGGCVVDVNFDGTAFRCTESTDCPSGLTCLNQVCVVSEVDAAPDASADAMAIDSGPLPGCPPSCSPLDPASTLCVCGFATWNESAALCAEGGYRLAKVSDAATSDLIKQALADDPDVGFGWIGGTDAEVEGIWRWTDDEVFWVGAADGEPPAGGFSDFIINEPNDAGGLEDCLGTSESGWNDVPCSNVGGFFCERLEP